MAAGWPHVAASIAAGAAAVGVVSLLRSRAEYDFAGKTVLITGGSRGLGLVLARALLARGAGVGLMARKPAELAQAVESLGPEARALGVAGDVRVPESCAQVVDEVVSRFGRLDVLVNNAGVILAAPLSRTSIDDFQALMDVHFWGTIHMTSAALPHLLARPGARIANICSIGAKVPVPHLSGLLRQQVRAGRPLLGARSGAPAARSGRLDESIPVSCARGRTCTPVSAATPRASTVVRSRSRDPRDGDERRTGGAVDSPRHGPGPGGSDAAGVDAVRGAAAALAPNLTAAAMSEVNKWLPDGRIPAPTVAGRSTPVRGGELPLPPAVRAAIVLGERAAEAEQRTLKKVHRCTGAEVHRCSYAGAALGRDGGGGGAGG